MTERRVGDMTPDEAYSAGAKAVALLLFVMAVFIGAGIFIGWAIWGLR